MENTALILIAIALVGFVYGYSAQLNPFTVPQKDPMPVWIIVAIIIVLCAVYNDIVPRTPWFLVQCVLSFCIPSLAGVALVLLCKKDAKFTSD